MTAIKCSVAVVFPDHTHTLPLIFLSCLKRISNAKYISCLLLISLLLLGDYTHFVIHPYYAAVAAVMKSEPLNRTKHYSLKPSRDDRVELTQADLTLRPS